MGSTALGAEKAIIFISDAHEKFYYENLNGYLFILYKQIKGMIDIDK